MSKFYGEMRGAAKNSVTRRGHNKLSAHLRGWNKGIEVECSVEDGVEMYRVYETGGSNNPNGVLIFQTKED